ncbi:polycystin family member [Anaeramoeba flamelloides]|uniref:Polycystin family member n=1 Tax=Anaeramoeba flamelloides TaxID=1746091 RepID=A0ABQ8YMS0_9EUKA|nr:polycystin family member [Anaeramoeba flamelloides]
MSQKSDTSSSSSTSSSDEDNKGGTNQLRQRRPTVGLNPFQNLKTNPLRLQVENLLGGTSSEEDDFNVNILEVSSDTESGSEYDEGFQEDQRIRLTLKRVFSYLDNQDLRRKFVKDLLVYVCFLILLIAFITMQRSVEENWEMYSGLDETFVLKQYPPDFSHVFKNLYDVGSVEELFQWARGPFVKGIVGNGEETEFIMESNIQIGALVIRQHRVDSQFCTVPKRYRNITGTKKCNPSYMEAFKSRESYGAKPWTYTSGSDTKIPNFWGKLTTYYGGGGFCVVIDKKSDIKTEIEYLEDNNYIDKSTRVVFFHLFVFNPNSWTFSELIPFFEFGPGGMIFPRVKFRSFKLDLYERSNDKIRIIIEALLLCFLVYYSYGIYKEYLLTYYRTANKWEYFKSFWNVLDLINILLFWGIVIIIMNFLFNKSSDNPDITSLDWVKLSSLSGKFSNLYNFIAFNAFLSIIKIFQFLRMNQRMSLLWDTLEGAMPNLAVFLVFFMIIFIAFSLAGQVIFGPSLDSFRDFTASIITSFKMSLGEIEFGELKQVNRVLGPVYYVFFTFFVIYTLMNMFLAILNDSYEKHHQSTSQDELNTALMKGVGKVKNVLKMVKGKMNKTDKTEHESEDEHEPTLSEVTQQALFKLKEMRKKYGKNRKLDIIEIRSIFDEIDGINLLFDQVAVELEEENMYDVKKPIKNQTNEELIRNLPNKERIKYLKKINKEEKKAIQDLKSKIDLILKSLN